MTDPKRLSDESLRKSRSHGCAPFSCSMCGAIDEALARGRELEEMRGFDRLAEILDKKVRTLKAENTALREALKFYASRRNYDNEQAPGTVVGSAGGDEWDKDTGDVARRALAALSTARTSGEGER